MLNQLHQRLSVAFGEVQSIISEYEQVVNNSIPSLLEPNNDGSTEQIIYNVKEAAAFLKVTNKTVYNMCKDGRLLKEDNYKSPKFIRLELEKGAKLVRNCVKKGRFR